MENKYQGFEKFFGKRYSINNKAQICKPNGHKVSPDEVYKQYKDVCEEVDKPVDITAEDVKEYVRSHTLSTDEDDFNLQDFITEYIHTYANPQNKSFGQLWRIGPAWKTIERMGAGVPVPSDLGQLQVAIRAYAINKGISKGAKLEDIKVILTNMAMEANEKRIRKIVDVIKYDPQCVEAADRAMDALHDFWQIRQSKDVFRTIMRHWVWQVKHKLLDLPTVWSLWVNFYGGTAIGKTTFLNTFGDIAFGDFAFSTSISKLLDEERQMLKLTGSYIINLDELSINNRDGQYIEKESGLGRDQQATLKSLLTQTKMQTRIMGGQSQTTRRLTFSCISSANEHLYDIIYDEKTMRRYYEFDCTVDKITDFGPMDEIKAHILDIWKSVDESLENGYWHPGSPVWAETRAEQDRYYPTNTTTGLWLKENRVVSCDKDESETDSLYDEYKAYCKERGHMSKSYTRWVTDIRHLVEGAAKSTHTFIRMKTGEDE